ncbi:hypothetical protein HA075_16700 [bacterium BFN5]|nr:hypothetical protein HA075_16700 [bacterium BFN5]
MSIKCQPGGFKLDFGSTVTILTTAACSPRKHTSQGIFTGVVLDDTDLKFERAAKHLTISMDSDYFEDEQNDDEDKCTFQEMKYPVMGDKKEYEWTKFCKDKETGEWYKDEIDKVDEKYPKPHKDKVCCEHKPDDKPQDKPEYKYEDKCHKPHKDKECCEHKHEHKCHPKKKDEYLLLSLTCPSFPFLPGQIVWINIEEIVALSVICKN